ncbi:hypothetical protein KFL_000600080 [Klebsormidium nitens]|uniref:DUF98 domain-containing protein n=1 Tax=Klebsormidium nitens TaxID=105231 RepID=A0A1Y1HUN0_KLENI|nr:hypothetical protein KFL_000600080 [Klebsormidium nitens]|eukprot:GAQ80691.1 hypothetical protein KFL_000600080 [Klebsormidium nitens]
MERFGVVMCMGLESGSTSSLKNPPEADNGTSNDLEGLARRPSTPDPSEVGTSYQAQNEENGRWQSGGSSETEKETLLEMAEGRRAAPWFPVEPIWQASEQDALRDEHLRRMLAPAWRVLLLSDGSVTRHLQLLSDFGSVTADCFQMAEIGDDLAGLPPGAELVPGPRVQRQVWLRTADGQPLVYAASWWSAREVRGYLKEVQKPIWVNLSETRAELYRDVQRLYLGFSDELERAFGVPGPFWSRHYVFYHDGRPLTLIYEVFSRSLEQYIGPMHPADKSRTN